MKVTKIIILLLATLFFNLSACKQHKEIQRAKADEKQIVPSAAFSLIDSLELHRFRFHTLAAKIKTEFKGNDGSELSVMVTMRSVYDSAIWLSVSPALGIEAARILFTRDSIKIMDKIHGEYAKESYTYLKNFTQTDINFTMLQNILTGNAAFINSNLITDSITRYYVAHCNQNELLQELVITKLFRILGNNITDLVSSDKIKLNYTDFQFVENEYFPFDLKIHADSKGKSINILMNYSNVSVNAPVEIRFNIPSSYTKMKY